MTLSFTYSRECLQSLGLMYRTKLHVYKGTLEIYWTKREITTKQRKKRKQQQHHSSDSKDFIIRSPSLFFEWISLRSEAICHFHARAIARRRKARFPLRMSRILFAAKHCWTALRMSRPLFVVSYSQATWWELGQWKERQMRFEW